MTSTSRFTYDLARISTFRDAAACERARQFPRSRIAEHPNPDFHIAVIDDPAAFYESFARDLVGRIRDSRDAGRSLVTILPVGPVPQFRLAAGTLNKERISLSHVTTFNMDEYADEDAVTAPISWEGSFQREMWKSLSPLLDEDLRPPAVQIHFPTSDVIGSYSTMIEDLGGADVVYGGIGWGGGHIAFWEPHLAFEFECDPAAYRRAGARTVELHPMTVRQNALHSFGGGLVVGTAQGEHHRPARDPRNQAPELLARRRPRQRLLLAAVHRAAGCSWARQRVRPWQPAAGGQRGLHDARYRRRRPRHLDVESVGPCARGTRTTTS